MRLFGGGEGGEDSGTIERGAFFIALICLQLFESVDISSVSSLLSSLSSLPLRFR